MKQFLALLLVAAMCLAVLAACASKQATEDPETEPPQTDAPEAPDDSGEDTQPPAEAEEPEADEGDADEEDEEMKEISMAYFDVMGCNSNSNNTDRINSAINAITESEYNLHIDILWWDPGIYLTQLSLGASTGDLPDIVCGFPMYSAANMQASGELLDISPYLSLDCAQGLLSEVGQYLGAFTINGGIYGVPASRIYTSQFYIIMRKDMLDEMGLTEKAQNMTTWTEYEEILAAVKANYDSIWPISKSGDKSVFANNSVRWTSLPERGAFSDHYLTDNLSDLSGFLESDDAGNVLLCYENEYWLDACKVAAEWNNNGWLYPDGAYSMEHADSLMKQGVQFSDIQASEVGIESSKANATGFEVVCTQISSGMVKTASLNSWGCALSSNCEEPEAALRFVSAMFTDSRL